MMRATAWLRGQIELGRGGPARLTSMEGLRGLAVSLVFLVHYSERLGTWAGDGAHLNGWILRIADAGNVGVDLFFVLSGYLIYGNLMRHEQDYRSFIRRRSRRIFPTFLVVMGAYVLLSLAMPSTSKLPQSVPEMVPYLLFNAMLLPGIVPVEAFITVAWSLSYEFFFYLTVPIFISRLGLREWTTRRRVRLLVAMGVGFLLLGGVISGTHPRICMFFGGMVLWEWLTYRWPGRADDAAAVRRADRLGVLALLVGLAAPLVLQSDVLLGLPRIAVVLVAWTVLCASCFAVDGACRRWFSWTPLRWLGNISYSYYLAHGLVLQAFFLALGLVWSPSGPVGWIWCVLLVPVFLLTVVGAAVLFILVEKPLSLDRRSLRELTAAWRQRT